jgi:hypothetical protein
MHNGIYKAWQATGLEATRASARLTDQLARVHAFSHLEAPSGMREDMVIDSPVTHNHYQAPPSPSPWPWVALAITAMLLAGALGAALLLRPAPPQTQRSSQSPGAPADIYSIRIYEPQDAGQ